MNTNNRNRSSSKIRIRAKTIVVQEYLPNLLSTWGNENCNDHHHHALDLGPLQLYQLGCILEYLSSSSTLAATKKNIDSGPKESSSAQSQRPILSTLYQQCSTYYDKYLQQLQHTTEGDARIRDVLNSYTASLIVLMETYPQPPQQQQPSGTLVALEDIHMALTSLTQLYNHSDIAYQTCFGGDDGGSRIGTWTTERLTALLHFSLSLNHHPKSDDDDDDVELRTEIQHAVYTILAYCLNVAPLPPPFAPTPFTAKRSTSKSSNEMILSILQLLQDDQNVWDRFVQYMNEYFPQWQEQVFQRSASQVYDADNVDDEAREQYYQDYLKSILSSTSKTSVSTTLPAIRHVQPKSSQQSKVPKRKVISPEEEIWSRIQQVKSILPQYGDGFIELALSCFNGNVETTIATLIDPQPQKQNWPVLLQNVDVTLPRRHVKDSVVQQQLDEQQAKEITKASIQAAQKQAELEARMLEYVAPNQEYSNDNMNVESDRSSTDRGNIRPANEYDDDYDDQYDYDVHYFVDAANDRDSTYDRPDQYEAVLTYNRTMKEIESDQEFWNTNRNTNRPGPTNSSSAALNSNHATDDDDNTKQQQYRGPDLLRGGRTPHGNNRNHGGGGRGRGKGKNGPPIPPPAASTSTATNANPATNPSPNHTGPVTASNARHKARVLDKRRDQQKKAQMKRAGA